MVEERCLTFISSLNNSLMQYLVDLHDQRIANGKILRALEDQVQALPHNPQAPLGEKKMLPFPRYQSEPIDQLTDDFNSSLSTVITQIEKLTNQGQEIQMLRHYLHGRGIKPVA